MVFDYFTYICGMDKAKYLKEYNCIVHENGVIQYKGKVKKQFLSGQYLVVKLKIGDLFRNVFVHRLVAMAFIPNPDNKPCVDHINGNKLNNHATNLRWCTISENNSFDNVNRISKLYPVKRIDKLGNIVCFDNILDACVFPWQKYVILQVCNGKRKTYNGYKWEHNDPAISGE